MAEHRLFKNKYQFQRELAYYGSLHCFHYYHGFIGFRALLQYKMSYPNQIQCDVIIAVNPLKKNFF